ncbi:hypothetical protein SDC9_10975 [bioreactor metagenome]|uniref:Uncharacterized protein n=2 Tax=root TaxID=1 RepID=G9XLI8_DESHA|nr:hypothetical protein [Desulfitobacterium hafniense]EHL07473.1 hypothetical protein HMPREF0322_01823 [Desulfitobacterium hafniense DP7]
MRNVLKRLDFNKFVEADFTYMRFVHVAKQESQMGMRERIDRELAVMIDDLMAINLEYNNVGKQVLAIWQGYWMAISALDIDVED